MRFQTIYEIKENVIRQANENPERILQTYLKSRRNIGISLKGITLNGIMEP